MKQANNPAHAGDPRVALMGRPFATSREPHISLIHRAELEHYKAPTVLTDPFPVERRRVLEIPILSLKAVTKFSGRVTSKPRQASPRSRVRRIAMSILDGPRFREFVTLLASCAPNNIFPQVRSTKDRTQNKTRSCATLKEIGALQPSRTSGSMAR